MKTKVTDKTMLDRLPAWARDRIALLERELAAAEKKLDQMVPRGDSLSDVGYQVLVDGMLEFRPLPERTTVIMRLDPKKDREVAVSVHDGRVELYGRDSYGTGALALHPTSTNTMDVFLDPSYQNENR